MPPFIFNPRDMALLLLCFFLQFELFIANHRLSLATFLVDFIDAPVLGDYTDDYGVIPGYFLFILAVPVRLLLCIWIAGVKVEMELVRAAMRDVDRALGPLPTHPEEEEADTSTKSAGFTGVPGDTFDDSDDEPEDSDSTGQLDEPPEQTDESTKASEVDDLGDINMFIEQYLPADEVASTSAPSTAENMVRQTCPASVVTRKY
jgi:hypothetical protein